MSEHEDRTQEPSKLRRRQARERGQAAHSPELTAASALLAAALALSWCGPSLAGSLVAMVREPLLEAPRLSVSADAAEVGSLLRSHGLALATPLAMILSASWLAAFGAHQGQVRGLWAPSAFVPDVKRLWTLGQGRGLATSAARGVWSLVKAVVVVVVAAAMIRYQWPTFQTIARVDSTPGLALTAGRALRDLTLALGLATLALGLLDFVMASQRFEDTLRLSPEEHREDLRAAEGDPSLRSRRRRLSQAWRVDSPEALAGASLVLTGPLGLTVVLVGGPLPRPISIRTVVAGTPGEKVRRASEKSRVPRAEASKLARKLSRRRPIGSPLPPEILAELKPLWPDRHQGC